jgi:hypothetical protein
MRLYFVNDKFKPITMSRSKLTGLAFVLIFLVISCKKDSNKKMVNITVQESQTHIPVSDAGVDVYEIRMTPPSAGGVNLNCGCIYGSIVFSTHTDTNGICQIPDSYYSNSLYGLVVNKDSYYPAATNQNLNIGATYYLLRINQIRVHLIKENNFPDSSSFYLQVYDKLPRKPLVYLSLPSLPQDSTFLIPAYGGETNGIDWSIAKPYSATLANGTIQLDVPSTGITDLEIKY